MKSVQGIGRQIAVSMVTATVTSLVMAFAGLYLFYALLLRFAPSLISEEAGLPGGIEWMMMITLLAVGAGVAFVFAVRLARHIVQPIVTVAASARRLADGDLTSRAVPARTPTGEVAGLVNDYNFLADRLEKSAEALLRWNATIAHELRTPVTILSGRLQGLADGVFQPEPALFTSLVSHVNGLAHLIEDLRIVSLMDGGHLEAAIRRVDLAAETEIITGLMRDPLADAGFQLILDLEDGTADVDIARIRQALIALLENIRRHARPGLALVRLRLTRDQVRIEVQDEGPGLPPDFVEYAFEPFRRYRDMNDPIKGSGLGLAVVQTIAQLHGGMAGYAQVDGGACFSMVFPRFRAPVAN
ncbi:ATP-binding protein [Croceibacterium xixiisoli]|nr:ATP-binding protein [Croceibacterium xixiisoli]